MYLFKITRDTNLWKKGQKVWADWLSGDLSAPAAGRYKGHGRWIKAWIHYDYEESPDEKPDAKYIDRVQTPEWFTEFIDKILW